MPDAIRMFGLTFPAVTVDWAVEEIVRLGRERRRTLVITPNVHQIVTLHERPELDAVYRSAGLLFADGMPLVWFSRLLPGNGLPERVTGIDLLNEICQVAPQHALRLFFLGGSPGAADRAAEVLRTRNPGLEIVGTLCPPRGFETDESETATVIEVCNRARPDLLFVGLGGPAQEIWSAANIARLDVGPLLCVGASFEMAAGVVRRAPPIWQRAGMEWLWRLLQEPRRLWRRYLVKDPAFLFLAFRELWRARAAR